LVGGDLDEAQTEAAAAVSLCNNDMARHAKELPRSLNALAQLLARAGRTEEALKVTQFHCRSVQSWKVGTLGAKGLYALYESHHTAPDAAPGNPRHGASGSRGPRQPRRAFAGNGTPRGRFIVECTRSVRTQEMHTYAAERN